MTFAQERNMLITKSFYDDGYVAVVPLDDILRSLEELERVYTPTVEMTQAQYDMLIEGVNLDHTSDNALAETLSADDYLDDGFNEDYWKPLTDRQVAQAWLHPECIKVVDDDVS